MQFGTLAREAWAGRGRACRAELRFTPPGQVHMGPRDHLCPLLHPWLTHVGAQVLPVPGMLLSRGTTSSRCLICGGVCD